MWERASAFALLVAVACGDSPSSPPADDTDGGGPSGTVSSSTTDGGTEPRGTTDTTSTGQDEPGDPEAFFPLARSGERLELRGFSFDGVPFVMEIYDTQLETPCEIHEYEGALRCVPTAAGIREYGCSEGCPPSGVLGRPKAEDCGPAYWPRPENLGASPLVRLAPLVVDDNTPLSTASVPVAAALLDTYAFDGEGGQPVGASELVAVEVALELNAQGVGVEVWTAEDGSRLVLGPYDARYGRMSVPDDASVPWLEPSANASLLFADGSCTQPVVCETSDGSGDDVPRLAADGEDVYLAGASVAGKESYSGPPKACNGPFGGFTCFEAVGPLVPATDYPAIVRDTVSNGDVSVDVLSLTSGERLGLAGTLHAGASDTCEPRRVGESFRCFPPQGLLEFGIGPLSVYADPDCTVLTIPSGFGLTSGTPYYRPSVGTCDPGGEIYAWAGEVANPTPFFSTPSGCTSITDSYTEPWNTYMPAGAEDFPGLDELEVF